MVNERTPRFVSPPGDSLADLLEERGLTIETLADQAGVPAGLIRGVIAAEIRITRRVAMALELATGAPATFWLERERRYRLALNTVESGGSDHE